MRSPLLLPFAAPLALLAAACAADPPPASGEDPVEGAETAEPDGDSGAADPAPWPDPIVRGAEMDLAVGGPELTDAAWAGDDLLLFAGQEQTGHGGVWAFDVADPAAPVLLGRTDTWHIQRVCWTGEHAWGTSRSGELMRVELEDGAPRVTDRFLLGPWGGGLDCDRERVAVALGLQGALLARVDGPAPDGLEELGRAEGKAIDTLLEDDRLWVLGDDKLVAYDLNDTGLAETGSVELSGACHDLAGGDDWLAVACGTGGVHLVDRGDGEPALLGSWAGHASARAVDVAGDHVLVAAWTDLLLLDASDPSAPWLRGSEPAGSSVMAVASAPDGLAWVADWNRPFGVSWTRDDAPEVRATVSTAVAGSTVTVLNDGPVPLRLGEPSVGSLSAAVLDPGAFALWSLPDDAAGDATVPTDDPDEPVFSVAISDGTGIQAGAEAPGFVEPDLDGVVWDLSALRGQVVFVALFNDGCPVCQSEVPDTDQFIAETFDGEPGLVALWSYAGPAGRARTWRDESGLRLPVLVDEDSSMRRAWFIENGDDAFAANPRHYVIDAEGRFAYVQTTVNPAGTEEAIRQALAAAR